MGEPANPTPEDRAETCMMAARVVANVRNDEAILGGVFPPDISLAIETVLAGTSLEIVHDRLAAIASAAIEEIVFSFAQEITLLRAQLAIVHGTTVQR